MGLTSMEGSSGWGWWFRHPMSLRGGRWPCGAYGDLQRLWSTLGVRRNKRWGCRRLRGTVGAAPHRQRQTVGMQFPFPSGVHWWLATPCGDLWCLRYPHPVLPRAPDVLGSAWPESQQFSLPPACAKWANVKSPRIEELRTLNSKSQGEILGCSLDPTSQICSHQAFIPKTTLPFDGPKVLPPNFMTFATAKASQIRTGATPLKADARRSPDSPLQTLGRCIGSESEIKPVYLSSSVLPFIISWTYVVACPGLLGSLLRDVGERQFSYQLSLCCHELAACWLNLSDKNQTLPEYSPCHTRVTCSSICTQLHYYQNCVSTKRSKCRWRSVLKVLAEAGEWNSSRSLPFRGVSVSSVQGWQTARPQPGEAKGMGVRERAQRWGRSPRMGNARALAGGHLRTGRLPKPGVLSLPRAGLIGGLRVRGADGWWQVQGVKGPCLG